MNKCSSLKPHSASGSMVPGTKLVKHKFAIQAIYIPLVLATWFALVINFPFLVKAAAFINKEGVELADIPFLISLPFFLFSVFLLISSILTVKYIEKPLLIGFSLISSIVSFSYGYYGLIFDDHSQMIGTVVQTDWKEISPFLTPSFFLWFFFTGILPSYVICKIKILRTSFIKEAGMKLVYILLYPVFFMTIVLSHLSMYHPLIRLSGLAARPPFQMVPTNFLENVFHYYKEQLASDLPWKNIGLDAQLNKNSEKKKLLLLVIGETARGMNFELNGYARATNAWTEKQNVISFRHMNACATSTRESIPCIFSSLGRTDFNSLMAEHEDNLLDILKRAGLKLFWIDNNGAGNCQGVCKHIASVITQGRDEALVKIVSDKIHEAENKDTVIVLHLLGSHGPDYHEKYPPAFQKFTPDCQRSELRLCDQQSLINAYDNSIFYTDFVLHELIKVLKKQSQFTQTALIYTSDHGESIGEKGLYGHCAPYMIAPVEQKQVPLLLWMSPAMSAAQHLSLDCLGKQAINKQYSHDYLFHSILSLMEVNSRVYQKDLDLFQLCRKVGVEP